MGILQKITDLIKAYIIARASKGKMIDIVEVRTKEIGLTKVVTETDIRIQNSFFLPITIVSIQTDLLNRDGLKVGRMSYTRPKKIKGNSHELLTTTSEISIITSIFQAISRLLSQNILMQSVGKAQVKVLWWIVEIPVNDSFEIHPEKLKILREETEEEKAARKQREAEWKEKYREMKETVSERSAERKERLLKRRYGADYIPKEEREKEKYKKEEEHIGSASPDHIEVKLDETVITEIDDSKTELEHPVIPSPAEDIVSDTEEKKEDNK
jgi:hypothetical protein